MYPKQLSTRYFQSNLNEYVCRASYYGLFFCQLQDSTDETQKLAEKNLKQAVCDKIPGKDSIPDCKQTTNGSGALVIKTAPAFIGVYLLITMF